MSRGCFPGPDRGPRRVVVLTCETARVRVFVGSDHAGFELKAHLLRELAKDDDADEGTVAYGG